MRENMVVYAHLDNENIIRYIGSGTKTRPYVKQNRVKEWHLVFPEGKPNVVIIGDCLSYEDALALEYYMYCSCKETIVNVAEPRPNRLMNFDFFNDYFYLDSTSPSGLRLKKKVAYNVKTNVGDCTGAISKTTNGKKYWRVKAGSESYLAHRVVYLLTYGAINNQLVINHIDGNGLNNSVSNLEQVSQKTNIFKKLKHSRNDLPIGISQVVYKGQLTGYMAKYVPSKSNKEVSRRFSLIAFGSLDSALIAAQTWREYYLHIEGIEFSSKDIPKMKIELQGYLKTTELKRTESIAYRQNDKWACRFLVKGVYLHCGTFDTPEEAVAAKIKMVKDYNDSIVIEL